jgi:hypothetical protein
MVTFSDTTLLLERHVSGSTPWPEAEQRMLRCSTGAEELIRLVVSQMRAFWDGGTAKEAKAALGYCETKKR